MIVGVGVDVVAIERIRTLYEKHGERLLKRIYTQIERDYCFGFSDPLPHLAARFAAKEAVYKALPGRGPIFWKEIEVQNDPSGRPHLHIFGETWKRAEQGGVSHSWISLAHDAGVAIAQVVLEGEPEYNKNEAHQHKEDRDAVYLDPGSQGS
ncbi:MAG: holo-ACP synthase [Candidatus Omnitrophica bacterium COP1]|nr:holo-ACP synthase [Candidatus Omnitrophica bacterium COP1]